MSVSNEPKSETPRVSVIMANYNGAAHIAEAVASVLGQREPRLELIVSDDGSSDDSLARAREAAGGDPRLVILETTRNTGPAGARNRALARARGDWIAIVDNDDRIEPDRLARLIGQAEADGAEIAADNMLVFYDDGARAPRRHVAGLSQARWIGAAAFVRADLGKEQLGYLKPIFRRAAFGDLLRYDESLTIGEDLQLVMELLMTGTRLRLYPEAGYHYRKRVGSISHRQNPKALDAMIAATDRLDPAGDSELARVLGQRRRVLRDARVFLDLVEALKQRRVAQAAAIALKRPRVVLELRHPVLARLRRRT